MGIIRDFFEEFWEEETGTNIPGDVLDTLIKNLEQDASNLMVSELNEAIKLPPKAARGLRKVLPWSKGRSLKSLKTIMSPAQKAAKLKSLKSSQKAIRNLNNLRKGTKLGGKLGKGSKAFKQLQKTVKTAKKVGRVGKNLGKSKGFLRGMAGLCKKYKKTCLAVGVLTIGTVYNDEIRDWLDNFVNGPELDPNDEGQGLDYVQYGTAEWRKRKGLPPLVD